MKKLLYLILLLPLWVNAQTNGTIQKTSATSVIRGNFGSLGADTIVSVRGVSVNGQLLQYNSTYKKWVPYTIPIDGSTGIISGGTITGLGGANAIVSAGTGTILDNTNPASPALYELSWSTDTIGLTDNATNYLYYDSLGVLNATTTIPNPANFRTRVYLGRAQKASGAITSINGAYVPIQQTPATIKDMFTAYGLTKSGLVVSPASTNLTIAVASGGIFSFGANFQNSVLNPNNLSYTANSPQTFRMVTSGNISVTDITVLPVASYNPTGTTISAIGGGANESSIFTVYKFPTTGNVRILYGQTLYSNLGNAVAAIGSYVPNPPAVFSDAIIIGYIAAVKTATDLSNTSQAVFVTTNKFGGVGGGFASTALTNYMQTDFSNKTAAVPISTTTISNGGTANGISYASDVLRLHKVTATTGGVLTTGTDTIAGNKRFTGVTTFATTITSSTPAGFYTLQGSGVSTDFSAIDLRNGSGTTRFGTEGNSGNKVFTGSTNNASIFGSSTNTPIEFGLNGTIKAVISTDGTISSTPQGTLYGTATGSITSAQLATSLTDETGTGSAVFSASPTFTGTVTIPSGSVLNTPASMAGTNITGTASGLSIGGSAATLTNTRTIWGQNFNGSANVSGDLSLGAAQLRVNTNFTGTQLAGSIYNLSDVGLTIYPIGGTTHDLTILNKLGSPILQNTTGTTSITIPGATTFTSISGAGDAIAGASASGTLNRIAIGSGLSLSGDTLTATGGSSGTITGSGTAGYLTKFNSASDVGNSIISQSGTDISIAGSLSIPTSVAYPGNITNGLKTYYNSTDGHVMYGAGSSYDVAILNKNGGSVMLVPTGTLNVNMGGTLTVSSTIAASNFSGTSSGTNTGDQTTITGNAGTATTLQNTRTIWGQNFNGSANVSGDLTGVGGISASGGYTQTGVIANTFTGTVTAPTFIGALTGNAGTATALQTARTIGTLTGDVTSAGSSFNGTGNNTNATTLATVNANVGSFGSSTSIPTFTVNGKGLITAASGNAVIAPAGTLTGATLAANVTASSLTSAAGGAFGTNAYTSTAYAPLASPALTGLPTAPTQTAGDNSTKIATTAYVDGAISSRTNRILKDWYTDANNVSTTETDLYDYTVPANTLVNNGDKLEFRISGGYGGTGNTKTLKVYFGTSLVSLNDPNTAGGSWIITGTIIKTGSTTYRINISELTNNVSEAYSSTSGTVTNYTGTNVFKITGTGVASADITAQMGYLEFKPAAL